LAVYSSDQHDEMKNLSQHKHFTRDQIKYDNNYCLNDREYEGKFKVG